MRSRLRRKLSCTEDPFRASIVANIRSKSMLSDINLQVLMLESACTTPNWPGAKPI